MGVVDLIAQDAKHYVDIAVAMATDKVWARTIKRRIKANTKKIFEREESVENWSKAFTDMAFRAAAAAEEEEEEEEEGEGGEGGWWGREEF
ncbi:hypothetical protein TeGR_g14486 [Tetraparma gracilis]|uniref:Uncharacterized protein n=1 Tax=Tetraparma gracilis TaxID=2962635 RepID=A0ABQ6MK86_9STRA|nr:hypothetical protein TeGR_g14486 [Tetraparma gracilis]